MLLFVSPSPSNMHGRVSSDQARNGGAFGGVEGYRVLDAAAALEAIDFFKVDGLLFLKSPEAFNEDVIEISAPSIQPL